MEINEISNFSVKRSRNKLLEACTSTPKEEFSEILRKLQDCEHSKLPIGLFFEFMKIAYQVNDNCKNLNTMLSADNKLDWNELAKINLDFEAHNNRKISDQCVISDQNQEDETSDSKEKELLETYDTDNSTHPTISSDTDFQKKHNSDQNLVANAENSNQIIRNLLHTEQVKSSEFKDTENFLMTLVKTNLSGILHEGLLDSVLPYMIPKPALSQPVIKKYTTNTDLKKVSSLSNNIETKAVASIVHKEKDKDKSKSNKKSMENEVEIHVYDEEKNIKKNFHCPQKLLIQKMRYFADVTTGQKLEEIDISVHCDVVIFDWLMRWVKKDIIKKSEWPVLEANNAIPIMVSASFLQMEPLLENCLQYCRENMSDILKTSTILTCLDDNLLTRLIEGFTNEDVESLKDKKDKIQSKLFCKLIMSLADVMPDNKKGHYSSLATLFKCSKCGKSITQSVSNYVPCIPNAMKIDSHGNVHSKHVRDLTWTLNDYIVTLRTELRSWRKVYWRLWGDCHFLFCTQCHTYFPIHQMNWCCCHTKLPQFFINKNQRPMPFPIGRYPCCSQRAHRFEVLTNSQEGCRYKEHIPDIRTEKDISVLNIFTVHREIIALEPPQLFFPEKVTRLVARDTSLQPGKLICKDTMWWDGIQFAPQPSKLGLLGKIWSGSGFRRSFHMVQDVQKSLHKIHRQISVITDSSSVVSSVTESDEDGTVTAYEDSSIEEDSYFSEESNAQITMRTKSEMERKLKNQITWRNNGRSWSDDLNVRYNQDNQRDFEEKAVLQMTALLTKRISADFSLSIKILNKHNRKKNQLNGGTYTKLEAEFRDQLNQFYKHKNMTGKYLLRAKSSK
ncbi:uncharacterized protein LOC143184398 [Calliopsis andreniformis]|uniref:uncharacterized protein LOC143184398 n=1 Tax=Calliopsis andreniformis TaxID=337506 RepID=UPI003FCCDA2E